LIYILSNQEIGVKMYNMMRVRLKV